MSYEANCAKHVVKAWYADLLHSRPLRATTLLERVGTSARTGEPIIQVLVGNQAILLYTDETGERIVLPGPNFEAGD